MTFSRVLNRPSFKVRCGLCGSRKPTVYGSSTSCSSVLPIYWFQGVSKPRPLRVRGGLLVSCTRLALSALLLPVTWLLSVPHEGLKSP